ncbi:MAG TPA: transporter substrate-binding domain-containing protein [Rhodocyclaceae bacterium]|nr:transporter substrate-binding domain-containing protein [Rhodocyclaceae bacterium]
MSLIRSTVVGVLLSLGATLGWAAPPQTVSAARATAAVERELDVRAKPWSGDFDAMVQRRVIRFLVPYSRTLSFVDHGVERGVTAEFARDFERWINARYKARLGKRPVTVFLLVTPRDKMLERLNEGRGDIIAGNLTVTDERLKFLDFVAPRDRTLIRELVVTGPSAPKLGSLEDLAGRTVYARPSSATHDSLVALDARLRDAGKPGLKIMATPEELSDEDALELVNAGALDTYVVDDWIARLWAQVLPKIVVRDDLVLRDGDYTGWAFRKNSPQLQAAIEAFYAEQVKKRGSIDARVARFHKRFKQIANNTGGAEAKRFQSTIGLFRTYGDRYDFDPLMLAAQGFQESRLDQKARSPVGAIGVMQVMPATGAELKVGNIRVTENNIHAGTKYMDQLMEREFSDAKFSQHDRALFAFAAYNAGPGNIRRMRGEAEKRGLDPNKWFDNVELVVADKIGYETTTYVRNIFKYYAAYRLTVDAESASEKAQQRLSAPER